MTNDRGGASEKQPGGGLGTTFLLLFGIFSFAAFVAVALAEVFVREAVPGGPSIAFYLLGSLAFGIPVSFLSWLVWWLRNRGLRKRDPDGKHEAYSFAATASAVSFLSCVASPLAALFGAVGIVSIRRAGGRLAGLNDARVATFLGAGILLYILYAKLTSMGMIQRDTEGAAALMRDVYTAQEAFKAAAHLDVDNDGVGEYGNIADLHANGYVRTWPGDPNQLRSGHTFALHVSESDPESAFWAYSRPMLNWNAPGDRPPLMFTGDRYFYIDESGVLWQNRYPVTFEHMTPRELVEQGWTTVGEAASTR